MSTWQGHHGLLRAFGQFEGRKSRVFPTAAIVGRSDTPIAAIVSAPNEDRDYHLVHVCPCYPRDVDRQRDALELSEEYRLYSWFKLEEFLSNLTAGEEQLHRIARASVKHRMRRGQLVG